MSNYNCLQCGACCLLKGVPKTKMCEHLVGVPMEKVCCGIYDNRPQVCRDFQKDGDACQMMRVWYETFVAINNGSWDPVKFLELMRERFSASLEKIRDSVAEHEETLDKIEKALKE